MVIIGIRGDAEVLLKLGPFDLSLALGKVKRLANVIISLARNTMGR